MRPGARPIAFAILFASTAGAADLRAAAAEDPRVTLVKALGLVGAQRDSLESAAREKKSAGLRDCFATKATDERLAADLAARVRPALPNDESVRPILRFLDTAAGKKLAAGVARRHRVPVSALLGPRFGRATLVAGVPMLPGELSAAEAQEIREFVASDAGKPLARILNDSAGFEQLLFTIHLRKDYAAECGIDLKPPPE
jgi:hypothetical protein